MAQIQLIPRSVMENMPWWKTLSPTEQRSVFLATQTLSEEMEKHGLSKLAIGEQLVRLREILEPKKKFCDYLRRNFPTCSLATAYRWIEQYETAKTKLPENFMKVAMSQGYHVIDAEMVELLPPPRTQDRTKIVAYLQRLKDARKRERATREQTHVNQELAMRECFNFLLSRYERLPPQGRVRSQWLEALFGMILSEVGSNTERHFTPIEVPDNFRVVRGRPRNIA
jgi:hypothetical protein